MALKRTFSVSESGAGAPVKRAKKSSRPSKRRMVGKSMANPTESGPERKRVDLNPSTGTVIVNGVSGMNILLLNGCAAGTDENNRIGRKIALKSVNIHCNFTGPLTSLVNESQDGTVIKWWIVSDNDPNGALPTAAQMFEAVGGSYVTAFNNTDYSARFKVIRTGDLVLASKSVQLAAGVTAPAPGFPDTQLLSVYEKLDMTTKFIGTGSTIAGIGSGGLYFCCCCSTNGDYSGPYMQNFASRVMYTDI